MTVRFRGALEVGYGDEDPDGGLAVPEELVRVDPGTGAEQVDEGVEGELVGGALIPHDVVGTLHGVRVHEPGTTAAG